jgi:hypothetical protein
MCQKEIKWRTTPFWRCECVTHEEGNQRTGSDLDLCMACGKREENDVPTDVIYRTYHGDEQDCYHVDFEEIKEKEAKLTP